MHQSSVPAQSVANTPQELGLTERQGAVIAVANNQLESGQKDAARKTLEQVVAKYPGTEGARAAHNRLKTLK